MTTDIQLFQAGGALADITAEYGNFAALGLIGFDHNDLTLARMVIVNGANQMNEWGAKGGQFHNLLTNENFDALKGYVLAIGKGQIWSVDYNEAQRLKEQGKEPPVYCKSSDGVKPDSEIQNPPCTSCRVCPKAKPTPNPAGGWDAPECSNSFKVLLAQWDDESQDYQVRMVTFSKTGTKPVRDFAKIFMDKKKPTWSAKVTITTKKEQGNGNTWFVPVLEPDYDQPVPKEHVPIILEKIQTFLPILAKADVKETGAAYSDDQAHPAGNAAAAPAQDDYADGPTLNATASRVDDTPPPPAPKVDVNDEKLKDDLGF